jgi:hypothetical protein
MPKFAFVPHSMLTRKPTHGAACNSCGLCCVMARCQLGRQLFGDIPQPCPALTRTGENTYACGVLAVEDTELRDAALLLIRAGEGCDARVNGEWINRDFHRQQDAADKKNRKAIKSAKRLWGLT